MIRTWAALERSRDILDAYAADYGRVPTESGRFDHLAPGAQALCDDIDAAAGFLYPFGVLPAVGGAAAATMGVAALTGRARPIVGAALAFSVAIVALIARHHATLGDVVAILE